MDDIQYGLPCDSVVAIIPENTPEVKIQGVGAGNVLVLLQQCPYTAVKLIVKINGCDYQTMGFAKCNWPDKWDADTGYNLAVMRAVRRAMRKAGMRAKDLHPKKEKGNNGMGTV